MNIQDILITKQILIFLQLHSLNKNNQEQSFQLKTIKNTIKIVLKKYN